MPLPIIPSYIAREPAFFLIIVSNAAKLERAPVTEVVIKLMSIPKSAPILANLRRLVKLLVK